LAATEKRRELCFDIGKLEESWLLARFEFDEQVDITIAARSPLQNRTEKREAANAVPMTERLKGGTIRKQAVLHSNCPFEPSRLDTIVLGHNPSAR
jgi:hypothetical protein